MKWKYVIANSWLYDWLGKRSYAQCGEDLIVADLLKHVKRGFYLEIGAYHPKQFSNTYWFYKKGWRGIVVEPNTDLAALYRFSRKNDRVVNAGVAIKNKMGEYYVFEDETRNTFNKVAARHYQNVGYKLLRVDTKKLLRLDQILKNTRKIDLLSIDTEGNDEQIIKTLNWEKYKPKVVVVEGESSGAFLEKKGYVLAGKTPYSLIYLLN